MQWVPFANGLDPSFQTYALTGNNQIYPIGSIGNPVDLNPVVFKFAAPYYDSAQVNYSLNFFSVSAQVFGTSFPAPPADNEGDIFATSAITFDNFPYLAADLSVNYESTSRNNRFYRLINASPFPVNINIASNSLPLTAALNGTYYKTTLLVNNTPVPALNTVTSFNRTTFPTICTVQATVSAVSCIGSLTSFYTPHTLALNSISAIFVNSFPVAEFVTYPTYYFTNAATPPTKLTSANYATLSPGVCFYGEGHTEAINLSARTESGITNYIWKDITNNPFLSVTNINFNTNTNTLSVSSVVGNYPVIPIGLQITNSLFPSSAPTTGYSDTDGTPFFYPYYTSTVDVSGNESTTNTNLKQSIKVVPYDPITYRLYPGTDSSDVYLPANGSLASFTASIAVGFNGPQTILPCFDKYGANWQWSAFTGCTTNPNSFVNAPSSWSTTASAGTYPKKWHNECNTTYDNCSAGNFVTTPVGCIGSVTYWSLSTADWQNVSTTLTPLTGNTFNYKLNFANPYNKVARTFTPTKVTPMLVTATQTVTCKINTDPFDWQPKVTTINASSALNILGTPVLRLYTPNRYMLTGTDVKFENITQNAGFLTNLTIDYGDGFTETLSGNNVANNFVHRYSTTGVKTVILSGDVSYGGSLSKTFSNLVNILNDYDEVDEKRFITQDTPLVPPYITKPLIAPNDNAVADNINNIISKIYNNLSYLEERGKVYPNKTSESYGWLGIPLLPEVPQITGYTWQDFYRIDCLESDITWDDLACVGPSNNIPVYVPPPTTSINIGLATIDKQKYVIDIKSNTNNVDIITEINKLTPTWNKLSPIDVTVNVYPGVTVGSNSVNLPALTLNSLPTRSTITLNNNGKIYGAGGSGGLGGYRTKGNNGSAGGDAILLKHRTTINNNGEIAAGGGGRGGGGGTDTYTTKTCTTDYECGGCTNCQTWSKGEFFQCSTNGGSGSEAPRGRRGQRHWYWCYYVSKTCQKSTDCSFWTYTTGDAGASGTAGSGTDGANGATSTYAGGLGAKAGKYLVGTDYLVVPVTGVLKGSTAAK
jgi:hypothetical protein